MRLCYSWEWNINVIKIAAKDVKLSPRNPIPHCVLWIIGTWDMFLEITRKWSGVKHQTKVMSCDCQVFDYTHCLVHTNRGISTHLIILI